VRENLKSAICEPPVPPRKFAVGDHLVTQARVHSAVEKRRRGLGGRYLPFGRVGIQAPQVERSVPIEVSAANKSGSVHLRSRSPASKSTDESGSPAPPALDH